MLKLSLPFHDMEQSGIPPIKRTDQLRSDKAGFIVCGADVTQQRMPTLPVVEDLDKVKQIRPGLGPGAIPSTIDTFLFQSSEETLHTGIIPTVSLAAH